MKQTTGTSKRGFTLIEILIVIAILTIIATISVRTFYNLKHTEAVRRDTSAISSLLETARIHSLSSRNNNQYGIHITDLDTVLFEGTSYTGSSMTTETLHGDVTFKTIDIANSSSTIVFEKLTGETDNYGTITLESKAANASSTITIDPTGTITTSFGS